MKAQGLNFELRSGDLIIPLHQLSRVPSTIRPCPSLSITMVSVVPIRRRTNRWTRAAIACFALSFCESTLALPRGRVYSAVRLLLSMDGTVIIEYLPQYARELVQMWRDSFVQGVWIRDPHAFEDQLSFVEQELVRSHSVFLVLEKSAGKVVGFLAATTEKISQLYVHVDHQGKGIGSMLVNLAKENSNGRLRLFTFERNKNAQRFYENHGFKIVARGFEKSWKLPDIEYEWCSDERNRTSAGSGLAMSGLLW